MSRRDASALLDPAVAVAGLLTRLGIFSLIVLVPMLAIISRRAVAVFVPLATILLFLAAALDGRIGQAILRSLRKLGSFPAIALVALLLFATASLLWTPRFDAAADRLLALTATLALILATVAALPEKTRPSDANLAPIGVAMATITLAASFLPGLPLGEVIGPGSATETQRAAMLLVMLVWPATAALLARNRLWAAWAIAVALALTLWLVRDLVVIAAFVLSGAAFLAALWRPILAIRVAGAIAIALLLLAPGLGWLMSVYGGFLIPSQGDETVAVWRDVTHAIPSRPGLGWGFEASASLVRTISNTPLGSPRNAGLQLWLELGAVGVVLATIAIVVGLRAIERASLILRPTALAVFVAAGTMMFGGLAAWSVAWVTAIGLAVILTAFVGRIRPRLRA